MRLKSIAKDFFAFYLRHAAELRALPANERAELLHLADDARHHDDYSMRVAAAIVLAALAEN